MLKQFLKHKSNIFISLILLLAAFMRLYRIQDYMTFLGDEGRDVLVAYNILHGHFTLLGPTASVGGFYFGPIYYYFMAPFLFLFHYNPVGPAVMVALFGIATVWLVYIVGKELLNTPSGLIAAFFYSLAPLVLAYSRSSWNPNPVPFFSLLVIWFVYRGVKKQNNSLTQTPPTSPYQGSKRIFRFIDFLLAGIFLGIAVELHFIVAILGIGVFFYILFAYLFIFRKINMFFLAIVNLGIGFFIGWLPYLGFEFRHGFPNTKSVFAFVFHSGKLSSDNGNFFMVVGNVFFRLFARLVAAFPPPEQFPNYGQLQISIWTAFILVLALGSVGLLVWQVITHPGLSATPPRQGINQSKNFNGFFLLLFWLVFGVLVFGIYKRQIYDYYFGFMFPLPFLLVANLLVWMWQKNTVLKSVAVVFFGILLYLNLLGLPFRFEPNRQLHQAEEIAQFVNEKTGGKSFNFALITGGNSDHAYRYFFTLWHHEPVTIENAVIDPQRKTVTSQLLVVCESIPCKPLGHPLFEIAGFGRADIAGHWTVSVVEVYKLVHYKGK